MVLKRFALEAATCRGSTDKHNCYLDSNCGWDDLAGTCFLAHDPHSDFTKAIMRCRGQTSSPDAALPGDDQDALYTPAIAACWHHKPALDDWRPCGGGSCKLYRAGGDDGLPEDRCMPDRLPPHLKPLDMYALLKRHYGASTEAAGAAAGSAVGAVEAGAGAGGGGGDGGGGHVLEGYGSCPTALLHHTMKTTCRHIERVDCLADNRCAWLSGIISGEYCVLSKETTIEALLGTGGFTRAVLQLESACKAATSQEACGQVPLVIRHHHHHQQQQEQQQQQARR